MRELQRLNLTGRAAALAEELQGQLHILSNLGQFLSTASPSALVQIRAEVVTSTAAADSLAERTESAVAVAGAEAQAAAEYEIATAALDRQMAATIAADRQNDALAHAMAKRFGIDLSDYDRERDDLARQRADAVAHHDKIGERQADVLLAQNTYDAMAASADKIVDPEERRRYLQQMQQQQENIANLRRALEQQIELQTRKQARSDGLSAEQTEEAVTKAKAEGIAKLDQLGHGLKGSDKAEATQTRLEAAVKQAQGTRTDTPALEHVRAALSPEAKAAAQQAMTIAASDHDAFTASLNLDGSPQVALSTAPDAHTKVETPAVAKAAGTSAQGLA